MFLYKTQVGVKFIDYVGERYKKTLKFLSYVIVSSGYILMAVMSFLLFYILYIFLTKPEVIKNIKVPPLMPLIPYLPSLFKIDFLPPFYFTYWIIAIAVIAMSHEFAHGIYSRFHNIRVKSTGFGFLGPFLAAFVEPDEKQMKKLKKFPQLSILSAGTFANAIMTVLFFAVLILFFHSFYVPGGVLFNTYTPGMLGVSSINMIGNISFNQNNSQQILDKINSEEISPDLVLPSEEGDVGFIGLNVDKEKYFIGLESLKEQLESEEEIVAYKDLPAINAGLKGAIIEINGGAIGDYDELGEKMESFSPGEQITIKTLYKDEIQEYEVKLAENENGDAIIGIGFFQESSYGIRSLLSGIFNLFKDPHTNYEPRFGSNFTIFIYNLLLWLILINLSVALVNMLPLGIFDGGRVFYLTVWGITKNEKIAKKAFSISTMIILIIFGLLMILWFLGMF